MTSSYRVSGGSQTMTTKEESCEARIQPYYKSRMETIGALLKVEQSVTSADLEDIADELSAAGVEVDEDDEVMREQAAQIIDEMPLAVEVKRVLVITLGTGGPGDWFECNLDDDGGIDGITYHFNDWFDHAEISVTHDENARAFCERFAEIANGA